MPSVYYIVYGIFFFIFGSVIGSFLNVVIYRTPIHESLVKGRSHCTTCGSQIKNYDLIPIISWICLLGKCRNCHSKISPRYTVVEAMTALLFTGAFLILGISWELAIAIVLFPVLICLSFIDIDHGEIPYWCSGTIAALGLLSFLIPASMPWYEHLIGAVIISVPFALLAFFGAMGGGDVQLIAAAGLLLGLSIIPAAFVGLLIGAIVGIVIKLVKKTSRISFGPYLSIGIAAGYLFGNNVIEWYMSFLK